MSRARFATDGTGNVTSGSARISANVPVGGVVAFSAPGLGIAGVGAAPSVRSFMVPAIRDRNRGLNTGIAISNSDGFSIEITLSLVTFDGRVVSSGTATKTLAANGHIAGFIDQLFPNAQTGSFQGSVIVNVNSASGRISGTGLQLGGTAGEFTTLPVVSVDPAVSNKELRFAHLAVGSGYSSTVFLLNPSGGVVTGEVQFLDDSGAPLAVSINGQTARDRASFTAASRGGVVFTLTKEGGLVPGSARVIANGAVDGTLLFSAPGLGIAGVGATTPLAGFITPVTRNVMNGISTGVAFAAADSSVALSLVLRDQNGQPVVDGRATLALAPGTHMARFIDELFPDVDTSDFQGTLTVTSSDGTISATAIQLGSRPGEFTTLPVTALQP